jgi:hypothetical protein
MRAKLASRTDTWSGSDWECFTLDFVDLLQPFRRTVALHHSEDAALTTN